eukprot:Sdes_comp9273_c0_seq2m757
MRGSPIVLNRTLYASLLPKTFGASGLKEHISKFGKVEDALVIKNKATGRSLQYGFVIMEDAQQCKIVLENKEARTIPTGETIELALSKHKISSRPNRKLFLENDSGDSFRGFFDI